MTERCQNADFCRKPQIFADSPFSSKFKHLDQKNSRRLELSISKKHPARKVGTRSRQCRPKVPGRFAFPGARNPRICSISRFGKYFPAISLDFLGVFLENPRKDPGNSHSLLEFSDWRAQDTADCRRKPKVFAGSRRLGSVTLGPSPLAQP